MLAGCVLVGKKKEGSYAQPLPADKAKRVFTIVKDELGGGLALCHENKYDRTNEQYITKQSLNSRPVAQNGNRTTIAYTLSLSLSHTHTHTQNTKYI